MLWVYMMYTYLPTVFFGDAQDWDRDFMKKVFISNNYFICVIRTLIYQYIVMYRFSQMAIWDFPLPSRFIFNYFELFYFDPYCLGYFDDYLGKVHPEKSKVSMLLMKHLMCWELTREELNLRDKIVKDYEKVKQIPKLYRGESAQPNRGADSLEVSQQVPALGCSRSKSPKNIGRSFTWKFEPRNVETGNPLMDNDFGVSGRNPSMSNSNFNSSGLLGSDSLLRNKKRLSSRREGVIFLFCIIIKGRAQEISVQRNVQV